MFLKSRACLLLILTGLTGMISCTEEMPDPLFTEGMIQGEVSMIESYAQEEGVNVLARGPYGDRSTSTNADGGYKIEGLGNGTYELEFSKEGYGSKKAYGIQVFGQDTVTRNIDLFTSMGALKLPGLVEVHTRDSYTWLQPDGLAIETDKSVTSQEDWGIRVFFARHPGVSYQDFYCTRNGRRLRRNGFDVLLVLVDNLPFDPYEKVYLIAYICNPEETGYWDAYWGRFAFSTLNADEHSQVMEFTMPAL